MRISDWSSDVCSSDLLRRIVAACGHDPSQVAHIEARFTAPVFPGETIHTEIWRDDRTVSFRARLVERDVVALDTGTIALRGKKNSLATLQLEIPRLPLAPRNAGPAKRLAPHRPEEPGAGKRRADTSRSPS